MDSWRAAFENMTMSEFVHLVGVWILHVRARVRDGEVVLCSCVSLDTAGVYNLIVKKRVTLKFIEDQERAVQSIHTTAPTELVFVGQTMPLIVRILQSGDATNLEKVIAAHVCDVAKRMQADRDFVDSMWMVDARNGCLYVTPEYRKMFAFVCGEHSYHATARSGMVKLEISSWVENNIEGIDACTFIAKKSGNQVSTLTAAKEYKNVIMHVKADRGDMQFSLSDIYTFGTRLIVRWYKSFDRGSSSSSGCGGNNNDDDGEIYSFKVDEKSDDKQTPSASATDELLLPASDQADKQMSTASADDKRRHTASCDDYQDNKRPRYPSATVDHALLAATKVFMDAALLQVSAGDNSVLVAELRGRLAAVTAELDVCRKRLDAVTTNRDRLKGLFAVLLKINKII